MIEKRVPKVSVVTAMYKHKPYLSRRIDSILNQTLQDWEWIIVDDCSPDGSFEYARELTAHDPRVTVLQNERNSHIAYTNQRGIDLARGEFLYRTDSDDYCDYRFLERMVDVMESHPSVVMAHCRGFYMDDQDGVWGGWPKKKDYVVSGWEELRRIIVRYHIKSPTILFRREAAVRAGGFATLPLLCNHDWYLSLRMCLLGDIAFLGETLSAHRRHEGSFSGGSHWRMDARQTENEFFGVIDDILLRVPAEHSREVAAIRRGAYLSAAAGVLASVHWARANQMEAQAEELEQMVRKYVPLEEIPHPEHRPSLPQRVRGRGLSLLKPLTYKRLPAMRLTQIGTPPAR